MPKYKGCSFTTSSGAIVMNRKSFPQEKIRNEEKCLVSKVVEGCADACRHCFMFLYPRTSLPSLYNCSYRGKHIQGLDTSLLLQKQDSFPCFPEAVTP